MRKAHLTGDELRLFMGQGFDRARAGESRADEVRGDDVGQVGRRAMFGILSYGITLLRKPVHRQTMGTSQGRSVIDEDVPSIHLKSRGTNSAPFSEPILPHRRGSHRVYHHATRSSMRAIS